MAGLSLPGGIAGTLKREGQAAREKDKPQERDKPRAKVQRFNTQPRSPVAT